MLYLGGSFRKRSEFCIPVVPLYGIFYSVSVSAKDLHSLSSDPLNNLCGVEFSHRSLFHALFPLTIEPGGFIDHKPCSFYLYSHISQLKTYSLKFGNRFSKRVPLFRVSKGIVESSLSHADRFSRMCDPCSKKGCHSAVKSSFSN